VCYTISVRRQRAVDLIDAVALDQRSDVSFNIVFHSRPSAVLCNEFKLKTGRGLREELACFNAMRAHITYAQRHVMIQGATSVLIFSNCLTGKTLTIKIL